MSGAKGTDGRTLWVAEDLGIDNEPLLLSLVKYRHRKNRHPATLGEVANLVSSLTADGRHMPVLDLDFDFRVEPSSSPGHFHLYLDTPISKTRWVLLMCALRLAGAIELGFFVWSLRRGANFVRVPGLVKAAGRESAKPQFGWLFRLPEG